MSSEAQIQANRANAQHSTGPVTEAGKAASSRNNYQTGFRSATLILRPEDRPIYEAILDELQQHFLAIDLTEERIVREMADAEFRLRRCRELMHTALACQMTKLQALHPNLSSLELEVQAIETLAETGCSWSTWLRYETKYERQYERAEQSWTRYHKEQRRVAGQNTDTRMLRHMFRNPLSDRKSASNVHSARSTPPPAPAKSASSENIPEPQWNQRAA